MQGFVAADYNGVIEALRAGHLDVAYLGPFSYVLGTTMTPIEAFAIAETAKSGRTFYHSQIIALKTAASRRSTSSRARPSPSSIPPRPPATSFRKAGLIKPASIPTRTSAA